MFNILCQNHYQLLAHSQLHCHLLLVSVVFLHFYFKLERTECRKEKVPPLSSFLWRWGAWKLQNKNYACCALIHRWNLVSSCHCSFWNLDQRLSFWNLDQRLCSRTPLLMKVKVFFRNFRNLCQGSGDALVFESIYLKYLYLGQWLIYRQSSLSSSWGCDQFSKDHLHPNHCLKTFCILHHPDLWYLYLYEEYDCHRCHFVNW